MDYKQKKDRLNKIIGCITKEDTAVAFSGGADSSLILKMAAEHAGINNTRVYAYTVHTELHAGSDIDNAVRIADELGVTHEILAVNELENAGIAYNPENRCYLCKRYMLNAIIESAGRCGIHTIVEGTNIDDTKMYRPGLKAIEESGVLSPLKDAGFTKEDVRKLATEYGISVASRPAMPCIATRFPYGTHLTMDKLNKVEQGEEYLRTFGLDNIRIRVHDNVARIETDIKQTDIVINRRQEIAEYLKTLGFDYVTLDLTGFRSGSMDEVIDIQES